MSLMLRSIIAIAIGTGAVAFPLSAGAQPSDDDGSEAAAWGVLSQLAGKKFVWNAGRARGSHEKELTFHEFRRSGQALLQTQCSYWPQKNMRPACGTHVIERLGDGSLVLRANGGTPVFIGKVGPSGTVEFVNSTWFGKFSTTFVAQADGSVALTHGNWVDGASLAPLIPIDAARESQIMAELESVHQSIQAQRRADADRQYGALMGALGTLNATLSADLLAARAREARSREGLDATIAQQADDARRQRQPQPEAQVSQLGAPPPLQQQAAAAGPRGSATASSTAALSFTLSSEPRGAIARPEPTAPMAAATTPAPADTSTRSSADGCVGQPVTSTHRCASNSGLVGRVLNSCAAPVDVRMCFMTDAGWKCQSRYGLAQEQAWEPGDCSARGQVFRSVRYSDSNEPLAQP